jgi:hypothetical protein
MDDLVKRLRSLVILDEVGSDNPLGRDAANRIEAQAAEIDRLRSRDWIGELLRWENYGCYVGTLLVGGITLFTDGWCACIPERFVGSKIPTEAEARAAVERAVREALTVKEPIECKT